MGTPLPPNLPANPCGTCFGLGKTFGDAPTPRVLILQFSGFTPDQAWDPATEQILLTPQYLIQQTDPCTYQINAGGILFFFQWRTLTTLCSIEQTPGVIEYFRGDVSDLCELLVQNELLTGINVATIGGVVTVGWNPEDL